MKPSEEEQASEDAAEAPAPSASQRDATTDFQKIQQDFQIREAELKKNFQIRQKSQ